MPVFWKEWRGLTYVARHGLANTVVLPACGTPDFDLGPGRNVPSLGGYISYEGTTEHSEETMEQALELFAASVSKIPQVVRVEFLQDDEGIDIWTFIENRDAAVRSRIHECQIRLLERFPSLLIDFHVVSNPQGSFYGTKQIYARAS